MNILEATTSEQLLAKKFMVLARWFEVVGDRAQAAHCRDRMDRIWLRLDKLALIAGESQEPKK